MLRHFGLVFVGLALLTTPILVAQRTPGTYTTYGEGSASCGEWLKLRADSADARGARIPGAWVLGFVSGAGWTGPRDLKKTDTAGIEAWMDNYCRANPLKQIVDGASTLVEELAAKN